MVDIILSYDDPVAVQEELAGLGVASDPDMNDEARYGYLKTPEIIDAVTGRRFCRVRVPQEVVDGVLASSPTTFIVEAGEPVVQVVKYVIPPTSTPEDLQLVEDGLVDAQVGRFSG